VKERGLHGEGEDDTEKTRMVQRMRGWGREGRRTVQRRKEDDAEKERGCCSAEKMCRERKRLLQ